MVTATVTPAITTPIGLKSIPELGEEIVSVHGIDRAGRCSWLMAVLHHRCHVASWKHDPLPHLLPCLTVIWEMGGVGGRSGEEGGVAHPLSRTNSSSDRKAFNGISRVCTCLCVGEVALKLCLAFTCVPLRCSWHQCLTNLPLIGLLCSYLLN